LEAGAGPLEIVNSEVFKDTPVHLAVCMDDLDVLKELLEKCRARGQALLGKDVNDTNADGASTTADESQAPLNRTVDGGQLTPLMLAYREKRPECMRLLLAAGAQPTLLGPVGGGGGKSGKKGGK
ncbi:hypothetical protein VaNZ11_011873, partial [Volvox africanus]